MTVGLLACLALLGTAPGAATTIGVAGPVQGGSCSDIDYSSGMGGQTLTCSFPCGQGSSLAGEVYARDPDAATAVSVKCADASDALACPAHTCAIAAGPTNYADPSGECEGASKEFWDSGLVLACASTPGINDTQDPHAEICRAVPDFPTCNAKRLDVCTGANPWVASLPPALLDGLVDPEVATGLDAVGALTSARAVVDEYVLALFYDSGYVGGNQSLAGPACDIVVYFVDKVGSRGTLHEVVPTPVVVEEILALIDA